MFHTVFRWYEAVCTGLVSGAILAEVGFCIYAFWRVATKGDE